MMEQDKHPYDYAALIFKYLKDEMTGEERQQLEDWLAEDERRRQLLTGFSDPQQLAADVAFFQDVDVDADWAAVAARADLKTDNGRALRMRFLRWASVAAILLLAVGSVWMLQPEPIPVIQPVAAKVVEDVLPGGNKATLQLAGGQVLNLDPATADTILDEDGTQIKHQQGNLVYNGRTAAAPAPGEMIQYNTLRTPKGGQFKLILADGTAVWLNASSSLRFPTAFAGNERTVELTGEGYFEVAHDGQKPFRVKVNGAEIQVLGTHFNIMGYQGITKATLTQGAIKIAAPGKRSRQLAPGQQALLKGNNEMVIGTADIEKALAWKNGLFCFRDDEMEEVMEQVARWYDVDIRVKGKPATKLISGNIRRQARLSQVLEMLNFVSGATFKMEGKTVTVSFSGSTNI